jgi:hypothetical protein
MIFHPAADFRRMSVNRPDVSPPVATVLFNSYLPVARVTSAAGGRISISLKANLAIQFGVARRVDPHPMARADRSCMTHSEVIFLGG